ncbi:MAG TPA: hypothetical protein VME46_09810 [Acidimicrobiales bacterium]|nr:hypothetical protein [Acidimicrobiales bacterium]
MTSTTITGTGNGPAARQADAPSFVNTLQSEWTKLRTLRSTPITLAIAAALVIGLSALITWAAYGSTPRHRTLTDQLDVLTAGWFAGLLTAMVLGVLVVTNEYSSGMVISTFLATPKRVRVLLAKVLAFSVLLLVIAELISFVTFFLSHAIASAFPRFYDPAIGDHNVLRGVIGIGLTAVLAGLMGVGLGALLRNAAAAIAVGVGISFVLPLVFLALPSSIQNPLLEYWPTQAGSQVREVARQAHSLTAWWGLGDFALFIVILLVAAGYALVKRDA